MLKVMILENGWGNKVQLLSSPGSILVDAATAAVQSVSWKAGYKGGTALSWTGMVVPVRFETTAGRPHRPMPRVAGRAGGMGRADMN